MSLDEQESHRDASPGASADSKDGAQGKEGGDKEGDRKDGDQKAGDGKQGDRKESGSGDDKGSKDDKKDDKPHSKTPLIIIGIVVLVIAIVGLIYWLVHRNQVSTDDAYTDGNVVTMVPKVSGYVLDLYVDDNSRVKKGDLLLRIDPRDYLTARDQAAAQLAMAQGQLQAAENSLHIARVQYPAQLESARAQARSAAANLEQARRSYARLHEVDRRATTQESIDQTTSQQSSADAGVKSADAQLAIAALVPEQIQQAVTAVAEREAEVQQAAAQLAQANLNIGYTEIRAPADGFITLRSAQVGGYLSAGSPMFMLVEPDVWVTANFKESQIGRMRLGDPVDIEIDAYSGMTLRGHVQSIQYGSGSRFSAFPAENATGNFVKIVQRIPVKIVIDSGLDPNAPLPLGLSVDPVVHFP
jgi:membrane fusion protein (multidrug efflux system)